MGLRTAAVTTMEELKNYFGNGEIWKAGGWQGDSYKGETRFYLAELKPAGMTYRVKVEATDDPSDSEEMVTEEPVKALAEFLGRDIPGGEHFERMSSGPDGMAGAIRALAAQVAGWGPRRASLAVRRASLVPDSGLAARVFAAAARAAAGSDLDEQEMSRLEKDMAGRGWKVKKVEDQRGLPELQVDVSGIYEATISLEGTMYEYKFGFRDHPELTEEGMTDDPIREFRAFYRSEAVEDAYYEANNAEKARAQEQTVGPAGPKKEPEQGKTAPPPKKTKKKDDLGGPEAWAPTMPAVYQ